MFIGIIKKREPRRFNYKSRYYDRESADIRKQKILDGEDDTSVNFSDRFHQKVVENRKIKGNYLKKLIIMMILLAFLVNLLLVLSKIS